MRSREEGEMLSHLAVRLVVVTHPLLITPFTVSRGDEVQAVCEGVLQAPELVRQLRYVCRPLRLRVGIGIGEVESGRESRSSWDMNGSAFVRARQALDVLKGSATGASTGSRERSPVRVTSVVSWDPSTDAVTQAMFGLMDAIESRWSEEQWEAVHLYERLGTYRAVSDVLGIAFQNVQKRCRTARWTEIREAEAALRTLGEMLMRGVPGFQGSPPSG